jgi:REP element-mobilizing transposase RayT
MSRPLRNNVVGGWYHVTSRGHNRREIFWDDGDRRHFLSLLMIEMHRVEVHRDASCGGALLRVDG